MIEVAVMAVMVVVMVRKVVLTLAAVMPMPRLILVRFPILP